MSNCFVSFFSFLLQFYKIHIKKPPCSLPCKINNQSMAVPCSFSPKISVRSSFSGVRNGCHRRLLMQKDGQVVCRKAANSVQIRYSSRDKVFEDQSMGIICYRDENGEIVCEGYDEGPRLQQQVSRTTFHPRDSEILDLLQKNWLQIVNGGGVYSGDDAMADGLKWNGTH